MTKTESLRNFKACCDDAPSRTHEDAKELNFILGDAVDELMFKLREVGFKANNNDLAFELEAGLYAYVKASNPDKDVFPLAEGFGEAMNGPARERVIAQTIRDRDFLANHGLLVKDTAASSLKIR